jgi:hypothetical protein
MRQLFSSCFALAVLIQVSKVDKIALPVNALAPDSTACLWEFPLFTTFAPNSHNGRYEQVIV